MDSPKKLKDLTLGEISDMCPKYKTANSCEGCPIEFECPRLFGKIVPWNWEFDLNMNAMIKGNEHE